MGTLTIIRGIPGSGKTTRANELINDGIIDVVHEANDHFYHNGEYYFEHHKLAQAHQECQDNVWRSLGRGMNVAVANTSLTWGDMSPYLVIARALDLAVDIMDMQYRFPNIHKVPEITVRDMERRWVGKDQFMSTYDRRFCQAFPGVYQIFS